jgi:outer membrane protein assembly factor BamB
MQSPGYAALSLALLALPSLWAENWPAWRGADASGISRETGAPIEWSKTRNVLWRIQLPDPGNSTPVVWGDRIFVTQAVSAGNRRTLMCLDRHTGKVLWQQGVTWTDPDPTHPTNPHASASPVTDGRLVIAWFGSAGLFAYDFEGREVWRRDLGRQKHTWGYGTSPVLDGDRVFLNFGPGERAYLIALDKNTGRTLWQADYPAGKGNAMNQWTAEDMFGTWSTPLVIRTGGREELIVTMPHRVRAFDPASGEDLWSCDGLGDLVYPSPVLADGILIALSGFGGPGLAVRPGGKGDVTASHRLWHQPKTRPFIGTGVVRGGHLYVADIQGIAHALELETGKTAWTERLQGSGESNAIWSSPVLQDDRIYVMNQSGDTFVYRASPAKFESLAVNSLGERSNSSVVISEGDVFLRTHEALWRIGAAR